jgi:hypothetical protein
LQTFDIQAWAYKYGSAGSRCHSLEARRKQTAGTAFCFLEVRFRNERTIELVVRGGATMRLIRGTVIVVVALAGVGFLAPNVQASPRQDVAFVANCYRQYLQRDPEPGGLRGWVDQLRGGASRDHVRAGILASDEYYMLQGGSDREFVIGLYRDVLGRDAARQEVDGWVQAIREHGGDRRDVTSDFVIGAREELRRRP